MTHFASNPIYRNGLSQLRNTMMNNNDTEAVHTLTKMMERILNGTEPERAMNVFICEVASLVYGNEYSNYMVRMMKESKTIA